jgi:hypothetical protein
VTAPGCLCRFVQTYAQFSGDDQRPKKRTQSWRIKPTSAPLRASVWIAKQSQCKWATDGHGLGLKESVAGFVHCCAQLCSSGDDQRPEKTNPILADQANERAAARLLAIEVGRGTFFCLVRPCADLCTISAMTNCRKNEPNSDGSSQRARRCAPQYGSRNKANANGPRMDTDIGVKGVGGRICALLCTIVQLRR